MSVGKYVVGFKCADGSIDWDATRSVTLKEARYLCRDAWENGVSNAAIYKLVKVPTGKAASR